MAGWRFWEQAKAVTGDWATSLFNNGLVKQPRELKTYRNYHSNDSTVGTSIDALVNMTCGNGIYATVKDKKSQPAIDIINELNERIRLDEVLINLNKCMRIFGFCPVERITKRGPPGGILELMVLDPEGVEYQRDSHGVFTGFTQKTDSKTIPFGPDDLVWFCNKQVGNAKGAMYGISDIKRVLPLLEVRDATLENINGILRNQARPPVIWKVNAEQDVKTLKTILQEARDASSDLVLFPKDSIDQEVVQIDPRIPYWEYVSYIDGLIFQGLHSPMLDYLRNATQASADTMLEVIRLDVEGAQRYLKRMVEHEFWEWHLRRKGWTGEVPACNFGAPKTALDDIKVDLFITKALETGYLTPEAFLAILQQKGITLPELPKTQPLPATAKAGGASTANVKVGENPDAANQPAPNT